LPTFPAARVGEERGRKGADHLDLSRERRVGYGNTCRARSHDHHHDRPGRAAGEPAILSGKGKKGGDVAAKIRERGASPRCFH